MNNIPSLTRRRAAIYTCGDKNTEYIGLGETHEANTPKSRTELNPIQSNKILADACIVTKKQK